MILIIDNYDSFTYNLVQYLGEVAPETRCEVARNDALSVEAVCDMAPRAIVLSPGPCTPNEAGICLELVSAVAWQTPILGVCLGHQAIAQAFGASIVRAPVPMHGKTSSIFHDGQNIFAGLDSPFTATRYHSLTVDRGSLPQSLRVLATTEDQTIMAIEHRNFRHVVGVQFHPESIFTQAGKKLLANFLKLHVAPEEVQCQRAL